MQDILMSLLWLVIWAAALFSAVIVTSTVIHDVDLNMQPDPVAWCFLIAPILWAIIIVFWFN